MTGPGRWGQGPGSEGHLAFLKAGGWLPLTLSGSSHIPTLDLSFHRTRGEEGVQAFIPHVSPILGAVP